MLTETIHIYFMPGMAANPSIFEHIKLPSPQFEVHLLEWKIPLDNEPIEAYAKRMLTDVIHTNGVLIGVSFGGILVQEMAKLITPKRVIIISSVKTKHELPKRMKLARTTKVYKVLPTQLASSIDVLAKYTFGNAIDKRVSLYKKYLSVSDKRYLDWAIKQVVCWEQEEPLANLIHIHGDKDGVFPIKNINDPIIVSEGTHVMVINKYRWFNANLPNLILHGVMA